MAVIPSFLPSVFPSFRPSESERFFVSITVGGFAFGLIGVERIPHALMLILAAGVLMQWTNALEEASRRGARAVRLKQFSPRGVWVKAGITPIGVGAVAGVLALGGASAAAVLTGAACPPHDAGGVAKYILPIVLGHHEKAGRAMRRGLPFVLLTVLIVPAAASGQQGPPFPDAAREWLSRDLPFRFQAMIALGDSLFNNGSCTRCHGDDATGTRRSWRLVCPTS